MNQVQTSAAPAESAPVAMTSPVPPASSFADSRNRRLAEWFEAWRKPVRHWPANHSVPTSDLDDVTQETFLRLLRYCDDVEVTHPRSYLFRIAKT